MSTAFVIDNGAYSIKVEHSDKSKPRFVFLSFLFSDILYSFSFEHFYVNLVFIL